MVGLLQYLLPQKCTRTSAACDLPKLLPQVLDAIVELMVDPFGNYLIQKLLDRCSEQQRLEVSVCLCAYGCAPSVFVCLCECGSLYSAGVEILLSVEAYATKEEGVLWLLTLHPSCMNGCAETCLLPFHDTNALLHR